MTASRPAWNGFAVPLFAFIHLLSCSPPPAVQPPETGVVRGRVVDASGSPVAEAVVGLAYSNVRVKAGADGTFALKGLGAGAYAVEAWAGAGEGLLRGSKAIEVAQAPSGEGLATDAGDVKVEGTGAFEGRVLKQGAAVQRAVVALEGVASVPVSEGAFVFAALAAGTYVPVVQTEDETRRFAAVVIEAGATKTLDLELSAGTAIGEGGIEGSVRTASGPASGARARLVPDGGVEAAATDAGGRFRSPGLPPGIYTLLVERDGLVPAVVTGVAPGFVVPTLVLANTITGCAQGGAVVGSAGDEDGDGVPDDAEPQACLCREGSEDEDADGVCDDVDDDVDGDGVRAGFDNCPTVEDAQQPDTDGDGIGDACEDADGDGIFDVLDLCDAQPGSDTGDRDGDGVGDGCDTCPDDARETADGDGDGRGDLCDACAAASDDGTDTDLDGVPDACDNCGTTANAAQLDSDDDGEGDACEDGDGDGISDAADLCPGLSNTSNGDVDGDGIGDPCDNCGTQANAGQANADGDAWGDTCDLCAGAANVQNVDSDGDGIGDECDNAPGTSNPLQVDADGDGIGDAEDTCPAVSDATNTDGDGDGVGDACDRCAAAADTAQANADGDAWGDACDACPQLATLAEVTAAACADGDGDGVRDVVDNCATRANADQADGDGDGRGNACDNCAARPNAAQEDADGDGTGDACEVDDDDDGIRDELDNCPEAANAGQEDLDGSGGGDACDEDDDGDAVPDATDNCARVVNPGQEDLDGTGGGDACDADDDADGIEDLYDNCADVPNAGQEDLDGDEDGDACDADDDGDGVADGTDNCPRVANPGQADADGTGPGDACTDDDDGDSVLDGPDNCDAVANTDQADLDADGRGNACDDDVDGDGVVPPADLCPAGAVFLSSTANDSDRDGCRDSDEDADDDGDGVPDTNDNCPLAANAGQADAEGDGLGDVCDPCPDVVGFTCTPPTLTLAAAPPLQLITGMYDAELGETVRLTASFDGFGGTPALSWRVIAGPRVSLVPGTASDATFVADGFGTIEVEVTGERLTRTATARVLVNVIPSRAQAVWFDPTATPGVGCNDASIGSSRAVPKCSLVPYLSALGFSTTRRHLHVRAGSVNFGGGLTMNGAQGPDRIVIFGGYGPGPTWRRDRFGTRTSFDASPGNYPFWISAGSNTFDMLLDGVSGGSVQGSTFAAVYGTAARLDVFNGFIRGGLSLNDTPSILAGNVFSWSGYGASGYASGAVPKIREHFNAYVNTGDGVNVQAIDARIASGNVITSINPAATWSGRPFVGTVADNVVAIPTPATTRRALLNLNLANLSFPVNRTGNCDGRNGSDTWSFTWQAPAADACQGRSPVPVLSDPMHAALLRYDANGIPRRADRPTAGPFQHPDTDGDGVEHWRDNCPDTPNPGQATGDCSAAGPPVVVLPGTVTANVGADTTVTPTVSANAGPVTYTVTRVAGVPLNLAVTGDSFTVRPLVVGTAILEVVATDTGSGRQVTSWTVVDAMPSVRTNGRTYYLNAYATAEGVGTRASPFKTWAALLTAADAGTGPVDVVLAKTDSYGESLPNTPAYFRDDMRVYGGYLAEKGWRRMPATWVTSAFGSDVSVYNQTGFASSRVVLDGIQWTAYPPRNIVFSNRNAVQLPNEFTIVRSRLVCEAGSNYDIGCWTTYNAAPTLRIVGTSIQAPVQRFGSSQNMALRLAGGAGPYLAFDDVELPGIAGSNGGPIGIKLESPIGGSYIGLRWVNPAFQPNFATGLSVQNAFTPTHFVANTLSATMTTYPAILGSVTKTFAEIAALATVDGSGPHDAQADCVASYYFPDRLLPGGACADAVPVALVPSDPELAADFEWNLRGQGDGLASVGSMELP